MSRSGSRGGVMLRVALSPNDAVQLAQENGAVVACRNSGTETIISGSAAAIAKIATRCAERGIETTKLAVSHAFHSPDMASAERPSWTD